MHLISTIFFHVCMRTISFFLPILGSFLVIYFCIFIHWGLYPFTFKTEFPIVVWIFIRTDATKATKMRNSVSMSSFMLSHVANISHPVTQSPSDIIAEWPEKLSVIRVEEPLLVSPLQWIPSRQSLDLNTRFTRCLPIIESLLNKRTQLSVVVTSIIQPVHPHNSYIATSEAVIPNGGPQMNGCSDANIDTMLLQARYLWKAKIPVSQTGLDPSTICWVTS